MFSSSTAQLLNQLAALHRHSLPAYLRFTRPWVGYEDEEAVDVLRQLASDHKYLVDKIVAQLEPLGLDLPLGQFPMEFTSLHDLSVEYLVKRTQQFQQGFVERLDDLAAVMPNEPPARELAEEALGMAKGHLKNLEEAAADLAAS
ncbi:hypothetical protein [Blastopirellula retiformator]|uniref:Ferritin-like domain protein n=1 Tax=Blastopirellula retiformator TaxID=2527970 RepID=A0A5C5V4Q0_9BACT|nr:hypothetical protein [Blastopirellula retiformator]TWT33311.1 hypothetical protein Enr8_31370 [Blastopirellula retiformator]